VIRESRGRLVCALEANGLHLPHGRLFLNLVPAARRKSGETLDLPLVLSAGAACGHLDPRWLAGALFLGEVGIDGTLHAVPGGLAAALVARNRGVPRLIGPVATAREAAWLPGMQAFGARHLHDVIQHLSSEMGTLEPFLPVAPASEPSDNEEHLDQVRGQSVGKLALAAAAAGGHGLLFIGPPGAGKSMLARRLIGLTSAPTIEERLEITRVLSAAGRWPGGLVTSRPFRAPHHTISYAGLVGGGGPPMAGEITLAHCGVLFLDELPEFRREVLESLRQPLETGSILISRAGRQLELPARFQLVAAMNPCPCGYQGHPRIPCRCPPGHVQRYLQRISGPLLDRIDLRIELDAPTLEELSPSHTSAAPARPLPTHAEWRGKVLAAREAMIARQRSRRNADLTGEELDHWVELEGESRRILAHAAAQRGLSARALQSLRRVARTLADLAGEERVEVKHLAQALGLRTPLI
jgi:magnesium chelatase family protein